MAKTVLIVDDQLFMRVKLKNILSSLDYQVIGEAANGAAAVESYQALRPDVVLMDITMPEMDGVTALRKIRSIDPKAIVVMVSAMGQERVVMDAVLAGAKSFVIKPFQEKKLEEVLAQL